MPAATGFVVAGGRSARMGLDKALLPWGDGTLLDHALRRLQAVCGEARILSGPEPRYVDRGVPVITDIVKNAGPLAGIHAGLLHLDAPAGLFLAVDVPLVPSVVLAALLRASDGHDAAVPVVNGQPEPLCAVYRQSCREAVARRLEGGERKMTSFWPDVRVRTLDEAELAAFGDPAGMFRNLNTLEEYRRLRPRGRRLRPLS
ncbi:MAG: molybdenum cofactor guanylyltransferase [Acidobacteria bacterium]|nr:MAG: molybdenum cofactor guanylyltransferase [Acidobacteriota bacterium]PYQ18365.1 MAG: molybdenum cofactor guanylyltransferase [Acidobacteriota bacterium]